MQNLSMVYYFLLTLALDVVEYFPYGQKMITHIFILS